MTDRPRPYYDEEMSQRRKRERELEEAEVLRRFKESLGFGTAIVINSDPNDPTPPVVTGKGQ